MIHGRSVFRRTDHANGDAIVLQVFQAVRTRHGDKGRDDRKFLEALHYFTVHNITWRALPAQFGHWNSIWKWFWRLSRAGVFEALFRCARNLTPRSPMIVFMPLGISSTKSTHGNREKPGQHIVEKAGGW